MVPACGDGHKKAKMVVLFNASVVSLFVDNLGPLDSDHSIQILTVTNSFSTISQPQQHCVESLLNVNNINTYMYDKVFNADYLPEMFFEYCSCLFAFFSYLHPLV